jgi:DnaK suppressor protein
MSQEEKTRYSENELKEFEAIIQDKLGMAKNELNELKKSITKGGDTGTDITNNSTKVLEDGADTMEKENMNQLAARQQKFINNLENAIIRIKNGTYGLCIDTGKLISKERLKAVPHTMHSIEAKLAQRN